MKAKLSNAQRDVAFINTLFTATISTALILAALKQMSRAGALSRAQVIAVFDEVKRGCYIDLPPSVDFPAFRRAHLKKLDALQQEVLAEGA